MTFFSIGASFPSVLHSARSVLAAAALSAGAAGGLSSIAGPENPESARFADFREMPDSKFSAEPAYLPLFRPDRERIDLPETSRRSENEANDTDTLTIFLLVIFWLAAIFFYATTED